MSRFPYSIMQIAFSLAGFFVAGLLYFAHRHAFDLPCNASGGGCELVNSSRWSHIGPVPIAAVGMLGYAVIAVLSVAKLTAEIPASRKFLNSLILVASFFGSGYSWYLQYVAAVDIQAFCIYCRTSAIVMSLICITALLERTSFHHKPIGAAP